MRPFGFRSPGLFSLVLASVLSSSLSAAAAENTFRFIVMSDLHIGQNDALHQTRYDQAVREIAESKPKPLAVFVTGDITDHGRESEFDNFSAWFVEPLKTAGIPLYAIPGSHDIGENTLALWTNKLGAPYYAVTLRKTRFIMTCGVPENFAGVFGAKSRPELKFGVGQGGVIDSNQLAWIRQALEAPESRSAALLLMMNHSPLWAHDFGDTEIKDVDFQGNPTDAGKLLRDWMDTLGVDLFLCGYRHVQAPPIMHEFPSGRRTWHVLNESSILGRISKTTDPKGKPRTCGGYGYAIYDVSGSTITHFRKTLDSSGFALVGPQNEFTVTAFEPPATPPPAIEQAAVPPPATEPAPAPAAVPPAAVPPTPAP